MKTSAFKLRRNDDPVTSHQSAFAVDTNKMESIVLQAIDSFGKDGCISDDVLKALPNYRYSSITARYKPLKEKGLVITDGTTSKGESGRSQLKMWSTKYYENTND